MVGVCISWSIGGRLNGWIYVDVLLLVFVLDNILLVSHLISFVCVVYLDETTGSTVHTLSSLPVDLGQQMWIALSLSVSEF